ncbi:MAG TPA: hypothetical protein VKA31_08400 [Mariprofundaceae bacterium]|nr:hypothetical protein [Mariprofundaceae bacterium]
MNSLKEALKPVHHGFGMAVLALILGALWAAYMATHHEQLHGAFEAQEAKQQQSQMQNMMEDMNMEGMAMDPAHKTATSENHTHGVESAHPGGAEPDHHAGEHAVAGMHSHSGSLAMDAMQRLLRGHIHFMGVGILAIVMLILVASSGLKSHGKKTFGWTFGLGALLYPPAWILMGFRTVELGPQAAEASVLWLFGPAVALLIGSLIALFAVMAIECTGLKNKSLFSWAFEE